MKKLKTADMKSIKGGSDWRCVAGCRIQYRNCLNAGNPLEDCLDEFNICANCTCSVIKLC